MQEMLRDPGLMPGSGRSPGEGHGKPLQYSCLENPMDRGAWRAIVHGVAKSQAWLTNIHNNHYLIVLHIQKNFFACSQPCLTLCSPVDCCPPDFSVHGILQARIPEWVVIPFSRGSSRPRDRTRVSHIAGRFFTIWATEYLLYMKIQQKRSFPVPPVMMFIF